MSFKTISHFHDCCDYDAMAYDNSFTNINSNKGKKKAIFEFTNK